MNYTWTRKQEKVMLDIRKNNPKITVLSGGKRAGKTFMAIICFVAHVQQFEGKGLDFILGGATISTIQRNVLNEMERMGIRTNLNKNNAFRLAGNNIYCLGGDNASSWKTARGFTAYGAYLNEGTALHQTFVKEVLTRCSGKGARIIIDTNPENPNHTIKKDFIDKSGELIDKTDRPNVLAYHFTMDDNTVLSNEYKQSIKQSIPAGYLYDRDILGLWVGVEGLIYKEFKAEKHLITVNKKQQYERYIAGVDFGFSEGHHGVIVVFGIKKGNYYLIEEHAHTGRYIDQWCEIALEIIDEYGDMVFFCDSARPEHVAKMRDKGIQAVLSNKRVMSGIETVAKLFYQNKLFISVAAKVFQEEIYNYVWNEKTGEPVKAYDDVLDAIRYALHTDSIVNQKDQVSADEGAEIVHKISIY